MQCIPETEFCLFQTFEVESRVLFPFSFTVGKHNYTSFCQTDILID